MPLLLLHDTHTTTNQLAHLPIHCHYPQYPYRGARSMEGQFFLFSALYWKNNSEPTHVGFCMSQPSPRRLCNLFSLFSSPNFTVLPYSPAFVRLCISVKLSFSWPFYVSPIDINCRWKLNTEVMITGKEISPYSYYGGGAPNGSPEATAGKETR